LLEHGGTVDFRLRYRELGIRARSGQSGEPGTPGDLPEGIANGKKVIRDSLFSLLESL
jgi:hypothetical protein